VLVHLVYVSETTGSDPVHDFQVVMEELKGFSPDLLQKPMFVVASKVDVAQDPERIERLRSLAVERELPFYEISSVTGQGIEGLKYKLAEFLSQPVEEGVKEEI
jgi:GTP-binding protein